MSVDYDQLMHEHYSNLPHPDNPELSVGDFPVAVKLATKMKGQGMATAKEAGAFWDEFQNLGLSPLHFEELLDQLAPLSWRYHNRPPTMREVGIHAEGDPKKARDYYGNLPSEHDPSVTAHEFVQAHAVAQRYSKQHLGRNPYALEVTYFHHARTPVGDIDAHYQKMKASRDMEPEAEPSATPL